MQSTLALRKSDFESAVGDFMGMGRNTEEWTDDEEIARVREDVATALRKFYFCGHPWSFLKPAAQVTLLTGNSTTALPDDFCGTDAGTMVSVLNSSDVAIWQVKLSGHGTV